MKIIKKTLDIIYTIIFVFLLAIAGLAAVSALGFPENLRFLVVQSGSMEPALGKGSLILVAPANEYKKDDVVTFKASPKQTITHRIIDVEESSGSIQYITKGDANQAPDIEKRAKSSILGKVRYSIPYLGYPVGFAKTQVGFILLIVIPATLIVFSELLNIKKEAVRLMKERKQRKLTTAEEIEEKVGEKVIAVEEDLKEILDK